MGETADLETMRAIWRRRWKIALAAFALPATVTLSAALFLPSIFRSTALVVLQLDRVDPAAPDSPEGLVQVLSQENMSRSHLQDLMSRYRLYPDLLAQGAIDPAVELFRRDIQIDFKQGESGGARDALAFSVGFSGRNAFTVADVTNDLAAFYVEQSAALRHKQSAEQVKVLGAQLDEVTRSLAAQEKQVAAFKAQHLLELPEQVRVNLATIERLDARLEFDRERQARLTAEERAPGSSAPQLDGNEIQLARLREQLKELRSQATDRYPDLQRLKAQIAMLTAHPTPALTNPPLAAHAPGAQAELGALESEEHALNQAIGEYQAKVYNAPRLEQELQTLLPGYQATRALHDTLLEKFEAARMEQQRESDGASAFRIVDAAVPSKAAAGPNRLRLLFMGFALSLGLALCSALLAEKLDTSFHSLDELRSMTRVPVLVSVPAIFTPQDALRRKQRALVAGALALISLGVSAAATYALTHQNDALARAVAGHGHA